MKSPQHYYLKYKTNFSKRLKIAQMIIIVFILCVFTKGFGMVNISNAKDPNTFADINNHWCQPVIEKFIKKNWVKGYDDGLFLPDKLITRAEFTSMVINVLNLNSIVADTQHGFSDVQKSKWYYNSVSVSASQKYIEGYTDNTFRPYKKMSREEVASFVQRILKVNPFMGNTAKKFKDEDSFSAWASNSIKALASHEIIKGYEDGTFRPKNPATRAEAVKMLDIILKELGIVELPQDEIPAIGLPINPGSTNSYFTPTPVSNITPTSTPLVSPTPSPTVTPTSTPLVSPTPSPTVTPTSTPLVSPTPSPTATSSRSFDPVIEWKWDNSSILSDSYNVMMTPAIIDLDNDGISEIVFGSNSSINGNRIEKGILRAIHGDTGKDFFTITNPEYMINTTSSIASADIDNDGKPEIIACDKTGKRLIAFENDGTFKWRSSILNNIDWGAPSIADIDTDGTPEIIIGSHVLNNDGTIRWTGHGGMGFGTSGPLSFAGDVDIDNNLDIICGNTLYDYKGNIIWQNRALPDGNNAIGNFDDDIYAEIVLVYNGKIWLLEHDGVIKWGPVSIPGGGYGGPPTVADFDNDGKAEIGVAGASMYTVFTSDGNILWSCDTHDKSSSTTGSTVFDFEGDGSFEVIYRDELSLKILKGEDGKVLYEMPLSSCTWYEYPLIADVDNDGSAEIVVGANKNWFNGSHAGLYVIGDANNSWVNTRKIWNQYSYNITNINDGGSVPHNIDSNWPLFNNFRCNPIINP